MSMHILITNDDGLQAEGLTILTQWAQKLGKVTVIAPVHQQSGTSHSINFHTPYSVEQVPFLSGVDAYAVDSTPADCIRIGFGLLHIPCELVLSGINSGINVGVDTLYSGTSAAAAEAITFGCAGIAISTFPDNIREAANSLDSLWEFFKEKKLLERHPLYNVNIARDAKGIVFTRFGDAYIRDRFIDKGNHLFMADGYSVYQPGEQIEDDLHAVMNQYTSISPMTIDKTDYTILNELQRQ